ncbi:Chitinase 4 [Linum perenne]
MATRLNLITAVACSAIFLLVAAVEATRVSNVISPAFFHGILDQTSPSCKGRAFYTRKSFLTAAKSYHHFAKLASVNDSKREIAAFFAHVTHQTAPFGRENRFDGLNDPDIVGRSPVVAWKTALWIWMRNVRPVLDQGFGATIRGVSGSECNGGNPENVQARVRYYVDYCKHFGVTPGPDLSC